MQSSWPWHIFVAVAVIVSMVDYSMAASATTTCFSCSSNDTNLCLDPFNGTKANPLVPLCSNATACTKLKKIWNGVMQVSRGCFFDSAVVNACPGGDIYGYGGYACECTGDFCNKGMSTRAQIFTFLGAVSVIGVIAKLNL